MKKLLAILVISVFFLWGTTAFPDPYDNFTYTLSSGEKTASGIVNAGACFFMGIVIETDGNNDATANCYNNASTGSGTKLTPDLVVVAADRYGGFAPPYPVYCSAGIYITLSGTGANAVVYYRKASSTYKIPVD